MTNSEILSQGLGPWNEHVLSSGNPEWGRDFSDKSLIGVNVSSGSRYPGIDIYSSRMPERRLYVDFDNCVCLLYTSPSPRDATLSRMPSSA